MCLDWDKMRKGGRTRPKSMDGGRVEGPGANDTGQRALTPEKERR